MFSFLVKKAVKIILVKVAKDPKLRNKLKKKAYSGFKSAKNIGENGEIIRNFGHKVGKLKKKIKDL